MSLRVDKPISRRNFLKWTGAATAASVTAANAPVLHALVPEKKDGPPTKIENRFSVCDMCLNKCGLIARLEDGLVTKLDPNPKFLKSRGMLCARGNAGIDQLYDPDRLKYPLLRKGKRGEGKWQRLSWNQAQLDTFGEVPFSDILHTKYIIMAGANRFEALITPDSIDLMTAKKNGCKLVVLDTRYTKTAALADEWYAIRPGTDMAFFLALANVIISEKLYDQALYRMLLGDTFLREKVKMMGIGADSKKRSAAKFRKRKNIAFPHFADEKREIFACLGKPVLPVSYLVQRQAGKRKIRLIQSGHIGNAEKLLAEIRSTVAGN